jgi:alpha-glucosidase
MKKAIISIFLLLFSIILRANQTLNLYSPDGLIQFLFEITSETPQYSLNFRNKAIIENASLGLYFSDRSFSKNCKIKKVRTQKKTDNYDLVVGKTKNVQSEYHEMTITLQNGTPPFCQINLIVRAYNDGIAFRYAFQKQKKWSSYQLTEEKTTFHFASNPNIYTLLLPSYTTSHEGIYTSTSLDNLPKDTLMDMPTLFQFSDSLFVSITDAALRDYAGMYLQKIDNRLLISRLSPLPNQNEVKVKAIFPHKTPWRVIMVASKVGDLIASNLLTNLNEPCKIKDISWIKPGKTTWTWWNGDIIKNQDFTVGQNFESHKYYIDFCAANHIEYHSIIEHGNVAWYQGVGEGFDPPPPNADVTKPVNSLDMERIAAYSREKGVGLRVWVHWKPLSEKMEAAFAQYEKWNIKGLMIDFMDRDDQEMVNWVELVLKTAAKYHLHVQFHGAYKPTGLARTYPNEFTKEGVLNLENLKWSNECDPEHNLMIPFTRMIAGPIDYHLGGFRSVTKEQFKANFYEPNVMGTRCHHLSLYVVFENYLQMLSDYPQAYQDQIGFEFLQEIPTIWDETRVLNAKIGDFITIARRKDKDWYVGAATDWTARTLPINLSFLPEGTFLATIYSDDEDAETYPNLLKKETRLVRNTDVLSAKLASGGGQAIWIKSIENNDALKIKKRRYF